MACFRHGVFLWLELVWALHVFLSQEEVGSLSLNIESRSGLPNCKITDNKKHTTTKLRHGQDEAVHYWHRGRHRCRQDHICKKHICWFWWYRLGNKDDGIMVSSPGIAAEEDSFGSIAYLSHDHYYKDFGAPSDGRSGQDQF